MRQFLKHRGFSNDMIKAVEEKTKRTSQEKEMEDRLVAEAMAKNMINEMMPMFRKHLAEQQKAKEKPVKKIIVPDDK